mmetsp:Transcript_4284/g.9330  ORF Transcript_4284/g.9330 Transcript_4284/m.9330 type:complete len:122 (+) Transcript_4284:801-1166(+)
MGRKAEVKHNRSCVINCSIGNRTEISKSDGECRIGANKFVIYFDGVDATIDEPIIFFQFLKVGKGNAGTNREAVGANRADATADRKSNELMRPLSVTGASTFLICYPWLLCLFRIRCMFFG